MNCQEFLEGFARGEITAAVREHVRTCSRCHELINALSQDAVSSPAVDASTVAAEAEVARVRKNIVIRRIVLIAIVVGVFLSLLLITTSTRSGLSLTQGLAITGAAVFIAILVAAPLLLLFEVVASARTRTGRVFYQRLKPGHLISGVCLGIAEATNVSVTMVRLAFLALFLLKGLGLVVYIVCALAMPVHPDDRQYLLRFRMARAFRRMAGRA
jgi:phage shock protein PspC (stress-responsive transcriptional regulator)